MTWIVKNLFLIPLLPLLAAGLTAVAKRPNRRFAATLAIGSMAVSFVLSLAAFFSTLGASTTPGPWRKFYNFDWFQIGDSTLRLGWVLDPLSAVMLVMVTFVGALIFIYSVGYMAHDENFTRFFCFLSLFAAAMLGLVIANSLLLLFMCWELVGLASYLLIGFWFHKPSAAAAAKKAFITTRIGDVVFFLGILWLYHQAGTLLFYDQGNGCLESSKLSELVLVTTVGGMAVSVGIGLLVFCGAIGKSGQVPLHVWLPDAMEGPTPVSALIHAATMVAAGVFLVARVYPLLNPNSAGVDGSADALTVVTWVGAITAVFAASIAVAQTDIKRILAYSTVSQLGFMMMGLGAGGVAVGMFHLITHAFFKALLFLGAGSVIHGCHEEQDIRHMGGLRKFMPVTFATYAVGMMALSGVPLFFSGFWSKDAILHAAHGWPVSRWPFYLGAFGALLTAFYMTRQVCYVFFGNYRGAAAHGDKHAHDAGHETGLISPATLQQIRSASDIVEVIGSYIPLKRAGSNFVALCPFHKETSPSFNVNAQRQVFHCFGCHKGGDVFTFVKEYENITFADAARRLAERAKIPLEKDNKPSQQQSQRHFSSAGAPHESPLVMTGPLMMLAVFAVLLGFIGTPAWPWFQGYLTGEHAAVNFNELFQGEMLATLLTSSAIVFIGIVLGWLCYGSRPVTKPDEVDVLERVRPDIFGLLRDKYYVDEFYEATVIGFMKWWARLCDSLDHWVWNGAVQAVSYLTIGLAWVDRYIDEFVVNLGFDESCKGIEEAGKDFSRLQNGKIRDYLRAIGVALVVLVVFLIWGCKPS